MLQGIDRVVIAMAGIRLVSSLLELTGALAMLWFGTTERALQVNGLLAMAGPLVLVSVTWLGVAGLASQISWWRIAVIVIGVACILMGAKR